MASDSKTICVIVNPQAVYSLEAARGALGLAPATLRREIRLGRLRVSKRAGRYYLLGVWLLEWLEAGEVTRYRKVGRGTDEVARQVDVRLVAADSGV
jgi:hypothetical protein